MITAISGWRTLGTKSRHEAPASHGSANALIDFWADIVDLDRDSQFVWE